MKYLVTFFAVVLIITKISAEDKKDWEIINHENFLKIRAECVAQKQISSENIEKFKKWDFADNEISRCYLECVFLKMGLFNQESGFILDHLVKQLGQNGKEDQVKPEIEKCIDHNEQKTDSCSWVYRGVKCFLNKNLLLAKESILDIEKKV